VMNPSAAVQAVSTHHLADALGAAQVDTEPQRHHDRQFRRDTDCRWWVSERAARRAILCETSSRHKGPNARTARRADGGNMRGKP
jgi:hypothetical protein